MSVMLEDSTQRDILDYTPTSPKLKLQMILSYLCFISIDMKEILNLTRCKLEVENEQI